MRRRPGRGFGRSLEGHRREGVRTPDIMASGGSGTGDGGGGIGTLLLLNLFRNQMNLPSTNGEKVK